MAAPSIGRRPNTIPLGLAQVNWSHPLAQGLQVFLYSAGGGSRAIHDVVRSRTWNMTTIYRTATYEVSPWGRVAGTDTDGADYFTDGPTTNRLPFISSATGAVSGMFIGRDHPSRMSALGIGAVPYDVGYTASVGQRHAFYFDTTTQVSAYYWTGNIYATVGAISDYHVYSTSQDSGSLDLYIDGGRAATGAGTAYIGTAAVETWHVAAFPVAVAIWSRRLGAAEHAALAQDPFQMLRW